MARIRTIKPEFWTSAQVVECSTNARLLFVGLWTFADDGGVIPNKPIQIKMQVFPGDDFTANQISGWLFELTNAGLIAGFENNNEQYLYVTGWDKHQRIDKPSKKYPQPFDEHSKNAPVALGDGKERKGMDRKDLNGSSAAPPNPAQEVFDQLWKVYPKRNGSNPKAKALKALTARLREGVTVDALRSGLDRYATWCAKTGKIGTETVMQASRFFGPGKEWENPWDGPPLKARKPRNDDEWLKLAAELNITAHVGETWPQFKDRIMAAA